MYKMSSLDTDINQHFQDAIDVISSHPYDEPDVEFKCYETLVNQQSPVRHSIIYPVTHASDAYYEWYETACHMDVNHLSHVVPDVSLGPSVSVDSPQFYLPPQRGVKGRKKLRLYEYLHEALHDNNMVDSIQWTDRCSGTFHFISKNKEKLAECWGQRKGNRKTMTYQKMARALRNYSRTGEIVKVRRKLTYQFNPAILQRLGTGAHFPGHVSGHPGRDMHPNYHHHQHHQQQHIISPDQVYYHGPVAPDWHNGYGHFPVQADCDLGTGFMSSSETKV